jgi:ketosteroid isomerase-like protein
MGEEQANRALVRHAYDLFAEGRLAEFIAMLDDDFVIHEVASLPYGGVHRGRAGFEALMSEIATKWWKSITFDVETIATEGDRAIAYGRMVLTGLTTGTTVEMPAAELWTLKNGRVCELRILYGDVALANRAMGYRAA